MFEKNVTLPKICNFKEQKETEYFLISLFASTGKK